jgi:hypothetical protein
MFIALQQQYLCAPAERHVLWRVAVYMPLLTERDRLGIWGYKHIAPPSKNPSIPMMTNFRAKPARGNDGVSGHITSDRGR